VRLWLTLDRALPSWMIPREFQPCNGLAHC
jgi:hypothetical protein